MRKRFLSAVFVSLTPVFLAAALVFLAAALVFLAACSSPQGWGVLLWSTEDPPLQSGTVLPVYVRSNIDKVWILGFPGGSRSRTDKFEVPLSRFEFVGSRSKAFKRAEVIFAQYPIQQS